MKPRFCGGSLQTAAEVKSKEPSKQKVELLVTGGCLDLWSCSEQRYGEHRKHRGSFTSASGAETEPWCVRRLCVVVFFFRRSTAITLGSERLNRLLTLNQRLVDSESTLNQL